MYFYPPGPNGPIPCGPYQGGMPPQSDGMGDTPATQPPLIYAPVTQSFAQSMPLVYLPRGYAAAYGHSPALSWPPSQYHWPMGMYQPVPTLVSSPPGAVGFVGAPMSRPNNPHPSVRGAWPTLLRQRDGHRRASAEQPRSRRKSASLSRYAPSLTRSAATSESTTASPHTWDDQEASAGWQTTSEGGSDQQVGVHADDVHLRKSAKPTASNPATHTAAPRKDEKSPAEAATSPTSQEREPCAYFLRTGDCIYGDECRFSHPTERKPALNADSLPMRPGTQDCRFYTQYKWCAFKKACKFNHPERSAADKHSSCETGHEDVTTCMESKYSIGTLDADTHALKLSS